MGEWYRLASEKADAAKKGAPRYVAWLVSFFFLFYFNSTHLSNTYFNLLSVNSVDLY